MLGKCPKCKSEELDYGESELESNSLAYEITCLDCGWVGYEVYSVEFIHYAELDGKLAEEV